MTLKLYNEINLFFLVTDLKNVAFLEHTTFTRVLFRLTHLHYTWIKSSTLLT